MSFAPIARPVFLSVCSRPEAASGEISGVAIGEVGVDNRVNVGVSPTRRCQPDQANCLFDQSSPLAAHVF